MIQKVNNHIILDCISTWPKELINIIKEKQNDLSSYLDFEKKIEKRYRKEIGLRISPPKNKHEKEWSAVTDVLKNKLSFNKFIGFHCTRLTDKEINKIKMKGLEPLNIQKLRTRLENLYENNKICKDHFEYLKNNNLAEAKNRKGRVHFFHAVHTLKSTTGLENLFNLWGGEALYLSYKNKPEIKNKLCKVGEACIVLGSLDYGDIEAFNPCIEQRLIEIYLNKNNLKNISYDFDSRVNHNVSVIDIITRKEDLFEYLTEF